MAPNVRAMQALRWAGGPAAVALAIVGFLLVAGLGAGPFQAGIARAEAQLSFEASCAPDPVRPGVPVLITCAGRLTNSGDAAATNLVVNIGPAAACAIPNRFSFVDRTVDGRLVPVEPQALSFGIGDVPAGATEENVTRVAVVSSRSGRNGGSASVISLDDRSVAASGEFCWDVREDAQEPPANLRVSKTLISGSGTGPLPPPFPRPVPPPTVEPAGEPILPDEPLPPLPGASPAEFEITVSNVSDQTMTGVTVLDVQNAGAVLVAAEPAASSADGLGRPIWELGDLAPGAEARIVTSYGPAIDSVCAAAGDLALVTATPGGGAPEVYPALAESSAPVGPCDTSLEFCYHYPEEGSPTTAPCDQEICWATPPAGGDPWPVYDCSTGFCWFTGPGASYDSLRPCDDPACWLPVPEGGGDFSYEVPCTVEFCQFTAPDGTGSTQGECAFPVCWATQPGDAAWQPLFGCEELGELCWFTPPGEGYVAQRPCADSVCWLSFAEGGIESFYDVPCDYEACEYTAPDGTTVTQSDCGARFCWTSPPGGGAWTPVYGCGEFDDLCWFTPPAGGTSQLASCDYPPRFALNPPPGSVDAGAGPQAVYFDGPACWPVPNADVPFHSYPVACGEIEFLRWYFPEGEPAYFTYGDICGGPVPLTADDVAPPSRPVPVPCDEGQTGEPGSSLPAQVVTAVGTGAQPVEGSVERIAPQPSSAVTPIEPAEGTLERLAPRPSEGVTTVTLAPTVRIEVAPDAFLPNEDGPARPVPPEAPTGGRDDDAQSPGEIRGPAAPDGGAVPKGQRPSVSTLPSAGAGSGDSAGATPWAAAGGLTLAGLVLAASALRWRRRPGL